MKWTESDLNTLRKLIQEGQTLNYIARKYETSVENIKVVCFRNNIIISELRPEKQSGAPSKLEREKNKDLASRLMALQGLAVISNNDSDFFFTDEQLKSWIGHPEIFCKDVLNIELQEYQIEMMNMFLNKKRVCICAGRGTGKSFTVAGFLIYNSVINPNQKQLIISPAERQSRLLFGTIQNFVAQSDDLFNSVDKRSNMESLKFTNGSEIIPLPSTTFIRGFQNVDFIVCDEAAFFMNPEQTFASIEPMLSIRNQRTNKYGSLILISSPNGTRGKFWEAFNSPLYVRKQISSSENEYASKEWLEEQKQLMSSNIYQQEILAQFVDTIDNFFSAELIEKCSKSYDLHNFPEENKKYRFGIDIGRVKDSSVICIISIDKDNIKRAEQIIELENKPFSVQIEHIKMLYERFKPVKIVIEKAGLSVPVVEKLKELRLPILEFVPTIDNKAEAYNNLLREMEQGLVEVPLKHQRLQYQLRTFRYEITSQGKMKLHHASEAEGDDFVDALCFAVYSGPKHQPLYTNISSRTETNQKASKYEMTWGEKLRQLKHINTIKY